MTGIEQAKERRIDAYIRFLEDVYQVDGYGLADLIGLNHATWTKNLNAPLGKKEWSFMVGLVSLTGISLDWLSSFDDAAE